MLSQLSPAIRQYLIVTGNYWAFTLTDGALRMLVVLHFHQLGYSALEVAMLFLFYEFFGIVTNLFGGHHPNDGEHRTRYQQHGKRHNLYAKPNIHGSVEPPTSAQPATK